MVNDILTIPKDASPQLKRAAIFISSGDFQSADAYCEKVLDAEPENAFAYLLKAMAKSQVQSVNALAGVDGLPELAEFKLARQFADAELAAELDGLLRICELRPMRTGCATRLRMLQALAQQELPENLAAAVQERIRAEQALMAAPDPEAAVREAAAAVALQNHILQRARLLQLVRQIKEDNVAFKRVDAPLSSKKNTRMLCERLSAAEALLNAPVSETPALVKEISSCESALAEWRAARDKRTVYLFPVYLVIAIAVALIIGWVIKNIEVPDSHPHLKYSGEQNFRLE